MVVLTSLGGERINPGSQKDLSFLFVQTFRLKQKSFLHKPMIKAICFDMDGVLVDATDWHFQAMNDALRLFGFEITHEEHVSEYDGLPTLKKLKRLSEQKRALQSVPEDCEDLVRAATSRGQDVLRISAVLRQIEQMPRVSDDVKGQIRQKVLAKETDREQEAAVSAFAEAIKFFTSWKKKTSII